MDNENKFMAAAVIMAGFCANAKHATLTEYYLAEMAVSAVNELEKAMGIDEKEKKGDK